MTFIINSTHIENDELLLSENSNGNLVLEHKPTGQTVALNGAAVEIDKDLSLNSGETAVDYTNKEVPQTFLGGPAASLSAYPLVHGTDTDAPVAAHHTPSSSARNLQPEGMQTGLAADVTGVQYSGEMYQYLDGALVADSRSVYLEAATNSSAGDEAVTVELYDPSGAVVLDSFVITGGSTRSRSADISASLTADSEVQVRWNVTTASATAGATFDAVGARLVIN